MSGRLEKTENKERIKQKSQRRWMSWSWARGDLNTAEEGGGDAEKDK